MQHLDDCIAMTSKILHKVSQRVAAKKWAKHAGKDKSQHLATEPEKILVSCTYFFELSTEE